MMIDRNTIRLAVLVLSGGLLAFPIHAQRNLTQEDLISHREEKFAETFIKNADWVTDYDKALAMAKKSGKPIFAYFSRSFAP